MRIRREPSIKPIKPIVRIQKDKKDKPLLERQFEQPKSKFDRRV